jgi:hypothetical protein
VIGTGTEKTPTDPSPRVAEIESEIRVQTPAMTLGCAEVIDIPTVAKVAPATTMPATGELLCAEAPVAVIVVVPSVLETVGGFVAPDSVLELTDVGLPHPERARANVIRVIQGLSRVEVRAMSVRSASDRPAVGARFCTAFVHPARGRCRRTGNPRKGFR